jgi:hypothetical protein
MKAGEILSGLDASDDELPEALLRQAVQQKDEITPGLIAAVEEIANHPGAFLENPERNLFYWATYLLTHFEEERALPAILKLFRLNDPYDEVALDIIVEDGAMILANLAGKNIDVVSELLHDDTAPSAAREAAADALGLLCAWGAIDQARVETEFRRALEQLGENDFLLATDILNAAVELNLRGLGSDLTRAFDRKLIDPDDFEFAAEWLHDPDFEPPPPYIHLVQSIDDIVEFFVEKAEREFDSDDEDF